MSEDITKIIAGLLGATGLGWVVKWWSDKTKRKYKDKRTILGWADDLEKRLVLMALKQKALETHLDQLTHEHEQCNNNMRKLQEKIEILEKQVAKLQAENLELRKGADFHE